MTSADLSWLNAIEPIEFLLSIWGKTGSTLANVTAMIDRFNIIGYWVPTEVCRQEDIKIRVKLIEKFIKIAKVFPAVLTTHASTA